MKNPNIQNHPEIEDLDTPDKLRSLSLFNQKISPFSPPKQSDFSLSEEETSYMFKNQRIAKLEKILQNSPKFAEDLSPIFSSPRKTIETHLQELKSHIVTLTKKFSSHQSEARVLASENIQLKDKIIRLQEGILNINDNVLQHKSRCNCEIF